MKYGLCIIIIDWALKLIAAISQFSYNLQFM